jgi:predicted secreted protein
MFTSCVSERAPMNWFTAVILYVLLWWTALFAVLPFGTRPVAEPDKLTGWRGAPASPRMWRKIGATTLVAAVIWLGCYALIASDWVSFRSGWLALPPEQ